MVLRVWPALLAALLMATVRLVAAADVDGSGDVYYYAADQRAAQRDVQTTVDQGESEQITSPSPVRVYEPNMIQSGEYSPEVYDQNSGYDQGFGCNSSCACEEAAGCCQSNPNPFHGLWFRGEYLMWWMKGGSAPPLVTTSPDGTSQADAGVLPDATILFPTNQLGTNGRPGGRFTLGYWMNEAETVGFEGNYFFLDKGGNAFSQTSDTNGNPILARPFFNTQTSAEDSVLVSYPGIVAGTITVASASDVLGAEANFRKAVWGNGAARLDVLAGYRFFQLHESLGIYESQISIDPGGSIPLGTIISVTDQFATKNEFHGGQIGLLLQKDFRRLTVEGIAKVAFGNMNQRVNIGGATTVSVPNSATVFEEGGILALGSNSGQFQRNRFATLPEFDLNLRYQLTNCWRVNVGYSLLVLPHVVRPGNNIDRRIDTDQFPPPISAGQYPQFRFNESTAWLQGVNVGVECRF